MGNRNGTNATLLSAKIYGDLNKTFVKHDFDSIRKSYRIWDWKLLDSQLQDITRDMHYKNEEDITPTGMRQFLSIFVKNFETCDKNADNVLSSQEFFGCFANDTYLSKIVLPNKDQAALTNYSIANTFYTTLFNLLDPYHNNSTNFHDYTTLRLLAFSWKQCSVFGPFLEEVNFECAIEIASGYKTFSRNTVRRLFTLGLKLSNSESIRNLYFITFSIIATTVRLYGKVNGKEDQDVTLTEMNLALDKLSFL